MRKYDHFNDPFKIDHGPKQQESFQDISRDAEVNVKSIKNQKPF